MGNFTPLMMAFGERPLISNEKLALFGNC